MKHTTCNATLHMHNTSIIGLFYGRRVETLVLSSTVHCRHMYMYMHAAAETSLQMGGDSSGMNNRRNIAHCAESTQYKRTTKSGGLSRICCE